MDVKSVKRKLNLKPRPMSNASTTNRNIMAFFYSHGDKQQQHEDLHYRKVYSRGKRPPYNEFESNKDEASSCISNNMLRKKQAYECEKSDQVKDDDSKHSFKPIVKGRSICLSEGICGCSSDSTPLVKPIAKPSRNSVVTTIFEHGRHSCDESKSDLSLQSHSTGTTAPTKSANYQDYNLCPVTPHSHHTGHQLVNPSCSQLIDGCKPLHSFDSKKYANATTRDFTYFLDTTFPESILLPIDL